MKATYEIVNRGHNYTGIRCLKCREVSYCLDDIRNEYCRFCKISLKGSQEKQAVVTKGYVLVHTSGKGRKVHYRRRDGLTLCNQPVGGTCNKFFGDPCLNCVSLAQQGRI